MQVLSSKYYQIFYDGLRLCAVSVHKKSGLAQKFLELAQKFLEKGSLGRDLSKLISLDVFGALTYMDIGNLQTAYRCYIQSNPLQIFEPIPALQTKLQREGVTQLVEGDPIKYSYRVSSTVRVSTDRTILPNYIDAIVRSYTVHIMDRGKDLLSSIPTVFLVNNLITLAGLHSEDDIVGGLDYGEIDVESLETLKFYIKLLDKAELPCFLAHRNSYISRIALEALDCRGEQSGVLDARRDATT